MNPSGRIESRVQQKALRGALALAALTAASAVTATPAWAHEGKFVADEQIDDTAIFKLYAALDPGIEQANRAVSSRRFAEARRLLEPCLKEIPDHFEAHYLLARMAYDDRDFAGALAHIETAERSLAELDRRYGKRLADLKVQDAADEQAYRDSLGELINRGIDPYGCARGTYVGKQSALSFFEQRKGHLFARESPFSVPADYRFLNGNCLYRLGRRTEALAQHRLAIQEDPSHANAWNNLIALLQETGEAPQARVELARAEAAHISIRPELKKAVLGTQ